LINYIKITLEKKRFFTKSKKDLPADTNWKPFLGSVEKRLRIKSLVRNCNNGSVQKVPYRTFSSNGKHGCVDRVSYRTISSNTKHGSVRNLFRKTMKKSSADKVSYPTFSKNHEKRSVGRVSNRTFYRNSREKFRINWYAPNLSTNVNPLRYSYWNDIHLEILSSLEL
jgi:hypothetical protein